MGSSGISFDFAKLNLALEYNVAGISARRGFLGMRATGIITSPEAALEIQASDTQM